MELEEMRPTRRSFVAGIASAAVAVAVATGAAARALYEREIQSLVDALRDGTESRPSREFSRSDAAGLPDPVRRYFETVLTEGRPYARSVRLEQRGEFRLGDADSPWRRFRATQRFAADPPGFVWDAKIRLVPFVTVRVVDAYVDGAGSLRARLLSVVPVADASSSPELDAGELSRYLAEAVWFPTALLPASGVEWEAIDDSSARATLEEGGTAVSLVFHFGEDDTVTRVTDDGRYREVEGDFERTPWTGRFRNYEERDGVVVPTEADVAWTLPEGDLRYFRATIENVERRPRS
ncbi:hypothetical protein SAMN04488063_1957 [Halopelagius inordinatus]|uniref:Uncharacterized protein n=1 Tax=Halopelagius inordinatus TaxID=553467 RepID=A0A1I2RKD9_9EURY|nr:DUF6544 family protein [Halopelagius inordinatus]SFG41115.1 hypothetical protein SAMN04488063_1957 [Halopelagius inordinatus]